MRCRSDRECHPSPVPMMVSRVSSARHPMVISVDIDKFMMTLYGKCTALSEVIIVPKDGYRSHKQQLTIQVLYSLNIKTK